MAWRLIDLRESRDFQRHDNNIGRPLPGANDHHDHPSEKETSDVPKARCSGVTLVLSFSFIVMRRAQQQHGAAGVLVSCSRFDLPLCGRGGRIILFFYYYFFFFVCRECFFRFAYPFLFFSDPLGVKVLGREASVFTAPMVFLALSMACILWTLMFVNEGDFLGGVPLHILLLLLERWIRYIDGNGGGLG